MGDEDHPSHEALRQWTVRRNCSAALSTQEVADVLALLPDVHLVGGILSWFLFDGRLDGASTKAILQRVPRRSWIADQIEAVEILGDPTLTSGARFVEMLRRRAWGLAGEVISNASAEDLAGIEASIHSTPLYRGIRHDLREAARKRRRTLQAGEQAAAG